MSHQDRHAALARLARLRSHVSVVLAISDRMARLADDEAILDQVADELSKEIVRLARQLLESDAHLPCCAGYVQQAIASPSSRRLRNEPQG
jgi:hypothetical protein